MNISSMINPMFNSMQFERGRMDPAAKFKALDTDNNGGLSKAEMDVMVNKVGNITGQAINTEEAMKTYDANSDGLLGEEEMGKLMMDLQEKMGPPGGMMGGMSSQRVSQAYMNAAGDDQMATLLELLDEHVGSTEVDDSSLDILLKE
ncbi:MAG: EF-hand domain-containing protein [Desulfocapsaceae bacterium]|nr:EF-hand domain-containing protein [Desulfocapsaceae bacterium]